MPSEQEQPMTMQDVMRFLEVSRATVYNMMADGRLTPLPPSNSAKRRQPRRFARDQVYALRPEKQP
jgi:predicted DNA-binding transcriptional regulator AlpA